jgi:hypothetical protein
MASRLDRLYAEHVIAPEMRDDAARNWEEERHLIFLQERVALMLSGLGLAALSDKVIFETPLPSEDGKLPFPQARLELGEHVELTLLLRPDGNLGDPGTLEARVHGSLLCALNRWNPPAFARPLPGSYGELDPLEDDELGRLPLDLKRKVDDLKAKGLSFDPELTAILDEQQAAFDYAKAQRREQEKISHERELRTDMTAMLPQIADILDLKAKDFIVEDEVPEQRGYYTIPRGRVLLDDAVHLVVYPHGGSDSYAVDIDVDGQRERVLVLQPDYEQRENLLTRLSDKLRGRQLRPMSVTAGEHQFSDQPLTVEDARRLYIKEAQEALTRRLDAVPTAALAQPPLSTLDSAAPAPEQAETKLPELSL